MKTRRLFPVMVCFLLASSAVIAADPPKTSAPAPPPMSAEQKAEMDAWMKMATPGDAHHKLAALEGTWDAKVTSWMAPGAPPDVSAGTTVYKMILGGRYLQQTVDGTMMGMPFAGMGFIGYDNMKKEYVSTWMDNMGTAIMDSAGPMDPSGVFTFMGTVQDPMSGKATDVKATITVKDADHHLYEMWGMGPDGKMFKTLEILYSRKK